MDPRRFITDYPCGAPLPNAVVGDNGQVCVSTLATTHLITDINGYFPT